MKPAGILCFIILIAAQSTAAADNATVEDAAGRLTCDSLIVCDGSWLPYPVYEDRAAWDEFFGHSKTDIIAGGERYLDYEWQQIPDSAYYEFIRSGDRGAMERPFFANRKALDMLALAELAEGKGRFVPAMANGLKHYSDMPTWVMSAHLPWDSCQQTGDMPRIDSLADGIIDIASASCAADMSMICTLLAGPLDSVAPGLLSATRDAIRKRILDPYLDDNARKRNWWTAESLSQGQIVNNWNPWCNSNVLLCFLLMEHDRDRLYDAIMLSARSTDRYLGYIKNDGACEEGPDYWENAAGRLYRYLKTLATASGSSFDIFNSARLRRMGEYIVHSYIGDGRQVNLADAQSMMTPDIPLIYSFGRDCGSREMTDFAIRLFRGRKNAGSPFMSHWNGILETLEAVRCLEELGGLPVSEKQHDVKGVWYEDTEVAYIRNRTGWFLAAKGGNNRESHNHNDVGSLILHVGSEPVFIDAGAEAYTGQTFGYDRYSLWQMRSAWHNLPMINGTEQIFGAEFMARDTRCHISLRRFSADISQAYSEAARCRSWVRRYSLRRETLRITDRFDLYSRVLPDTVNFLIQGTVIIPDSSCNKRAESRRKEILIVNGNVSVRMTFPSSMSVYVTERRLDDEVMQKNWGSLLRRISFVSSEDAPLRGKYVFVVKRQKDRPL